MKYIKVAEVKNGKEHVMGNRSDRKFKKQAGCGSRITGIGDPWDE